MLGQHPGRLDIDLVAQISGVFVREGDRLGRLGDANDGVKPEVLLAGWDGEGKCAVQLEGQVIGVPIEAQVHVLDDHEVADALVAQEGVHLLVRAAVLVA